jgi:hypothetical protein
MTIESQTLRTKAAPRDAAVLVDEFDARGFESDELRRALHDAAGLPPIRTDARSLFQSRGYRCCAQTRYSISDDLHFD